MGLNLGFLTWFFREEGDVQTAEKALGGEGCFPCLATRLDIEVRTKGHVEGLGYSGHLGSVSWAPSFILVLVY